MRVKLLIIAALLSLGFKNYSQTIYGAVAPDSIKKKCQTVITEEIGATAFSNNVRFIKSDAHTKDNVINGFTLFYSFNFPNVKESHVVFTIEYILGKGVIKDAAFKNYTRLPGSIKKSGAKVISLKDAKKTAIASDTLLKKHSDKLYGEISTNYDTEKKDYYFVWHFYHLEPCKKCEMEMYTTISAYINATTGKVLHNVEERQ
jgi:hypothetical protein